MQKAQIADVQQQLAQIAPLTFQRTRATEISAENKKAIEFTNSWIDRVTESFDSELDISGYAGEGG